MLILKICVNTQEAIKCGMLVFSQYTTEAKEPVVDADTPLDSLDSKALL